MVGGVTPLTVFDDDKLKMVNPLLVVTAVVIKIVCNDDGGKSEINRSKVTMVWQNM